MVTSANSASTAYHLHVDPLASASSVLQAHFATPPPRRSAHPTNHNIAYLAQIPAEYIDDVFPFFIEYVYKGRYRLPGDLSPAERARALFKISVMGSLLGVQRMRLTAIEQLAEVLRTWEVRDDVQDVARVCNLIYIVFDARPMGLRVGYTDPHAPSPPSPPAPQQAVPVAPSSPGRDGRVQGDIGLAIRGLGPPLPMRDREMEQRRMDEEDMKRVRWLEKQRLPQRMLVAKWAAGMKTMLWKWEEFRCCVRNAESGFETFFVENLGDGQGVVSGELDHEVYRKYL